ncbi:MAG: hypothetical protein IPP78_14625 [Holophagaceae bacterium]|nr:hypothetical protein [Holophagaceae bacterium]
MYDLAAVDISTGHALDSIFRKELRDPWAVQALQLFVDLAVNHSLLVYPQPSASAVVHDLDENLPAVFAEWRKDTWRLIRALDGDPAGSIALDSSLVCNQFNNFGEWLRQTPADLSRLKSFINMHFREARITVAHGMVFPTHFVTQFIPNLPLEALAKDLSLSKAQVAYAFDVFIRGIQYNVLCASTAPYFPHPVRHRLDLYRSTIDFESQSAWSWGAYITNLVQEDETYLSLSAVLEIVQAIKERVLKGANWYTLASYAPEDQLAAVESVASEAGLPAKLKEKIQGTVEKNLRALGILSTPASALVGGSTTLLGLSVGVLVSAGSYELAEASKKYLPHALSGFKVLKGHVYWPGLRKSVT